MGGIGWGYNATDGSIYVELYGYDFGCEVDKIGNYPVDYVWGKCEVDKIGNYPVDYVWGKCEVDKIGNYPVDYVWGKDVPISTEFLIYLFNC